MKLESSTTYKNAKWITDLNIRPGIIKLLNKIIGEEIHDTGFGKFLIGHENHR